MALLEHHIYVGHELKLARRNAPRTDNLLARLVSCFKLVFNWKITTLLLYLIMYVFCLIDPSCFTFELTRAYITSMYMYTVPVFTM